METEYKADQFDADTIKELLHQSKYGSLQNSVTSIAELIGDLKKTIPTAVNDNYKTFYEKYFQLIIDRTNQIAQRIDEID
mgnify:FL=1|tara:strand:- start:857 stop:1096 length:240 start_codon:yes stop_codon:yes gene_type:complete